MKSSRTPTILATSGGFRRGERTELAPAGLLLHAIALAEAEHAPKLCYIGTALGDQRHMNAAVVNAFTGTDVQVSVLNLFPMPNYADMREHILSQDVVWVGGGSVAGLLAMWRLHGLNEILREAWEAGVVLSGVSAGSICWFQGGPTDSFGPELQHVTNGLELLPYGNGVHYDTEEQRRPLLHKLVADGVFSEAHATEDGTGIMYRGTELVEAVAEQEGKKAYIVRRGADGAVSEEELPLRLVR